MKGGMKTSTHLPKDWREGRRLRAWELYEQGWAQKKIAEALGVTARSRQSMDKPWQGSRSRSVAPSAIAGRTAKTETGTACPIACPVGQGSRSLWVPRPSVDRRACRGADQTRVCRELSSDPL